MVNEQLSNCISILRIKGKNQCYFADFFNKKCNLFHFCTLYNRMSYQKNVISKDKFFDFFSTSLHKLLHIINLFAVPFVECRTDHL